MRWFVLAGGKGERMFPFTSIIAKCLLPVNGIPCVRRIVDQLVQQGQDDIVICINRWSESQFRHEFRDVNVKFSVSEDGLGTAGELFCARKLINDTFGIIYGDDLTFNDYKTLIDFHKGSESDVSLALTTNVPSEVGIVDVDETGRVKKFNEKTSINRPIWTGIAILEPEIVRYFAVGKDIAKDVIPSALSDGLNVRGHLTNNLWLDIGNLHHWRIVNKVYAEYNAMEQRSKNSS